MTNNCKRDGTEKCHNPENNRPNGTCVLWGCPQAGKSKEQKPKCFGSDTEDTGNKCEHCNHAIACSEEAERLGRGD